MESLPPYVQFDRVEVMYNELVAGLRGVTLDVACQEFVYLCGPTGSGKSTMLKLLSRQIRPTKGRVLIDGEDVGALPQKEVPFLRRQMGVVPQDFALLPNKKVWENVAYAMRAIGRTRREVRQMVPDILDKVHILHRADAYPHELSGGEQQRVAIGRALINDPPLLLADEPTGNLDAGHSDEIMEILRDLNGQGTTVLVATHDVMVMQRFPQRTISLEFGRVVSDTPVIPEAAVEAIAHGTPMQPVCEDEIEEESDGLVGQS